MFRSESAFAKVRECHLAIVFSEIRELNVLSSKEIARAVQSEKNICWRPT